MKTIKKFWGVVFILALLSTLLIGTVPQASANSYAWANSLATPNSVAGDTTLATTGNFSVLDVAQSGSTIWLVATDNVNAFLLYKSIDAGATWARVVPTTPPLVGDIYPLIAVAPDNPAIIAIVDTDPILADVVYYSQDSGNTFTALTATVADINSISIAPVTVVGRRIAVGGHTTGPVASGSLDPYLAAWTVGGTVTAWTAPAGWSNAANAGGIVNIDDVEAVAFSPLFLGDQALMVLTESVGSSTTPQTNGIIALHCYSYNQNDWDQNIDPYFPKYLVRTTNNQLVMGRAQMSLDPNFYMGDAASQLLFIGANITSNVTAVVNTQVGGVFRTGTYSIVAGNYTLTQCMTGTAINSVAWDGTNLMAAQQGYFPAGLPVWRCNNALATSGWSFQLNSTTKTPGTGNATLLLFNGGVGYAFSRSVVSGAAGNYNGSMICKTTDYGANFNGIALGPFNSFGTIEDFYVAPDGSCTYAVTSDNVDTMIWKLTGRTWQRVGILPAAGGQNWLVRVDKDNTDTVYIARKGLANMYKSLDGGNTAWTPRTCTQNIWDFAVQDAITVYVLVNASTTFTKSTSGAFTWSTPATVVFASGGGNCFSINLISDNNILIGGTAGGIAYSTDGGTSFTYLGALRGAGNNTLVTATGLATGDTIFAVSDALAPPANGVYRWQLGTTNGGTFAPGQLTVGATGIAYANGVLYVLSNGNNNLYRFINPTNPAIPGGGVGAANDIFATGAAGLFDQTNMVNALQVAASGTTDTLWARLWVTDPTAMPALDQLWSLTDYMTTAADAPVATYPSNTIIPINSISGGVASFSFQWNAPPSIAASQVSIPGLAYNYNLAVYLDAAGTVLAAGTAGAGVLAAASAQPTCAVSSTFPTAGVAFTGAAGTAAPGTTYYWRVRAFTAFPAQSQWSSMQTFVVEQLVAIVPIIASPENGGEVTTVNPAFSWSPIANATSYRFELSMTDNFSDIVYTVDPVTAGASVPSTIKLTRGMQYFWHVRTLTPTEGEWSTTANFIVAELPPTSPTPTTTVVPTPTYTVSVTIPPGTTQVITVPPAETKEVNPSYIWAIIIVGAVLVIAVIILIVRTRRTV